MYQSCAYLSNVLVSVDSVVATTDKMDSIVLGNVSMDLDSSHEERAEHQCDFCHVSYTTDTVHL